MLDPLSDYPPRVFAAIGAIEASGELSTEEWVVLSDLVRVVAICRCIREIVPDAGLSRAANPQKPL